MKVRKASGLVPYTFKRGRLYIMLVKSSSGNRWVLPKGGLEPEETLRSNAEKEAYEEAGVVIDSRYKPKKLGKFSVVKNGEELNNVVMFAGAIASVLDDYPEKAIRKRKLVTFNEAMKCLDPYLQTFILKLRYEVGEDNG
jgi:8-oxo-dGTP pyrophosphatase MutT (NUDIX family)